MPGLVLCFVLRFESRKRTNNLYNNDPLLFINRLTYFQCSLVGYCAGTKIFLERIKYYFPPLIQGLIAATVSSEIFKCAQPALLFLVPFTLIPLLSIAYLKVNWMIKNLSLSLSESKISFRVIFIQCGQIHSLRITRYHLHHANYYMSNVR